jgi:hypothetical protein
MLAAAIIAPIQADRRHLARVASQLAHRGGAAERVNLHEQFLLTATSGDQGMVR